MYDSTLIINRESAIKMWENIAVNLVSLTFTTLKIKEY